MVRSLLLLAALVASAPAAAGPPDDAAHVTVLPGYREADGRHVAALKVELAPGWKTYWRSPGPLGVPPQIDLSGSINLDGAALDYPVPQILDQGGARTIGYTGEVTFPLTVEVDEPGEAVDLSGVLWLGICRDICVPARFDLKATLPATPGSDPMIEAARALSPGRMAPPTCVTRPDAEGVAISMTLDPPLDVEAAVIEVDDPGLWVSETELVGRAPTTVSARMVTLDGGPVALDRSDMRVTVLGEGQAFEARGCQPG